MPAITAGGTKGTGKGPGASEGRVVAVAVLDSARTE